MTVRTAAGGSNQLRTPPLLGSRAVLVPVKSFADAKRRLEPALADSERLALVRAMAGRVLAAAWPLSAAVVCNDREVADWARSRGAFVIWEPGRGLNGAVEAGVERLARIGVTEVTVAHGDLPMASGLGSLEPFAGVTLVPDLRGDGTNVLRLPSRCGFRFSYGPGSFERHVHECRRIEVPVRVLRIHDLSCDVDTPADLHWTSNGGQ